MATEVKTVTAEELLAMPSGQWRYELFRGQLTTMSPAGHRHGEIAAEMVRRVGNHVREHRLGRSYSSEAGFLIERNPDTVLAPDASFVQSARIPTGLLPTGYFPSYPDFAVEVMSPSDTSDEVETKAQRWLAAGTQLVWVIDPKFEVVTIYKPDGKIRTVDSSETLSADPVLAGFSVKVAELFEVL